MAPPDPVFAGAGVTPLSHKAWTAYCSPLLSTVLALVVLGGATWLLSRRLFALVVGAILLVSLVHLLTLRSHRLYCDEAGVWIASGILPWSRGVQGVAWRDLEEVRCSAGFWSWILRSHTLCIRHRPLKSGEIRLTHMSNGKRAAALIPERRPGRHPPQRLR